jgi:cytosine/adenosine deaminase-related metal-dependent hydrolase
MPIRVVRRYGWAHSFALEHRPAGARGEPGGEIAQRWRRTPADAPFCVHVAEGVDATAAAELDRLEWLGCLTPNTVIVHGVAIDAGGMRRVAQSGAGLVWCPSSNAFMFGRTADVRSFVLAAPESPRLGLGTDSRLTGANDLMDELRCARDAGALTANELLNAVTRGGGALLRQRYAGRLIVGGPADLVVVPGRSDDPADSLLAARRRDVRLVTIAGRPLVAAPSYAAVFHARRTVARPLCVDHVEKFADSALARRIAGCPIAEPGVAV